MNGQPPANQPPAPGVPQAPTGPAPTESPAPTAQPSARVNATTELRPPLAAAMQPARKAKDSGLKAIPELIEPMGAACPTLASILGSSAVGVSLESYGRQDTESVRQQDLLKREAFQSNLCLLAAGVISGLVLAVSAGALDFVVSPGTPGAGGTVKSVAVLILGLLTLALGALAAYFAYIARDQGRIARWQTCRGEAEAARLDVFTTISAKSVEAAATAGLAVALYGLAVVVRHLLDDQRAWLGSSVVWHRTSSERTSQIGAIGSALAFIGGSGAIIASQTGGGAAVWIVFAGVLGGAIGAYAANREALNRDRANAERYDKTRSAMDAIADRVLS
jgi:hypothetical protein